jgi:hypothetical protein
MKGELFSSREVDVEADPPIVRSAEADPKTLSSTEVRVFSQEKLSADSDEVEDLVLFLFLFFPFPAIAEIHKRSTENQKKRFMNPEEALN